MESLGKAIFGQQHGLHIPGIRTKPMSQRNNRVQLLLTHANGMIVTVLRRHCIGLPSEPVREIKLGIKIAGCISGDFLHRLASR